MSELKPEELIKAVQGTIGDFKKYIENKDLDDGDIRKILEVEKNGKDRKEAKKIIEDELNYLEKGSRIQNAEKDVKEIEEAIEKLSGKIELRDEGEELSSIEIVNAVSQNIPELKEKVRKNNPDEKSLEKLLEAEKNGKNRVTARNFLEDSLKEFQASKDLEKASEDVEDLENRLEDLEKIAEDQEPRLEKEDYEEELSRMEEAIKNQEKSAPKKSGTRLRVFELDGKEFAFPEEEVLEILPEKNSNTLGIEKKNAISGFLEKNNEKIGVIDLEESLDLEEQPSESIIVIQESNFKAGVLVDSVKGIESFSSDKLHEVPEILKEDVREEYLEQTAIKGDELIVVLDLENGLEESEKKFLENPGKREDEKEESKKDDYKPKSDGQEPDSGPEKENDNQEERITEESEENAKKVEIEADSVTFQVPDAGTIPDLEDADTEVVRDSGEGKRKDNSDGGDMPDLNEVSGSEGNNSEDSSPDLPDLDGEDAQKSEQSETSGNNDSDFQTPSSGSMPDLSEEGSGSGSQSQSSGKDDGRDENSDNEGSGGEPDLPDLDGGEDTESDEQEKDEEENSGPDLPDMDSDSSSDDSKSDADSDLPDLDGDGNEDDEEDPGGPDLPDLDGGEEKDESDESESDDLPDLGGENGEEEDDEDDSDELPDLGGSEEAHEEEDEENSEEDEDSGEMTREDYIDKLKDEFDEDKLEEASTKDLKILSEEFDQSEEEDSEMERKKKLRDELGLDLSDEELKDTSIDELENEADEMTHREELISELAKQDGMDPEDLKKATTGDLERLTKKSIDTDEEESYEMREEAEEDLEMLMGAGKGSSSSEGEEDEGMKDKINDAKAQIVDLFDRGGEDNQNTPDIDPEKVKDLLEEYKDLPREESAIKTAHVMKGFLEQNLDMKKEMTYKELAKNMPKKEEDMEKLSNFFLKMHREQYIGNIEITSTESFMSNCMNILDKF